MLTGRIIRICNLTDARERMKAAIEILKARGLTVSKAEGDRYVITSIEKSLEDIDDEVVGVLKPRFIGFQNREIFREL